MNHHGHNFAFETKFTAMTKESKGIRLLHIPLRTIDWTEGEHVWFDAKMILDPTITVAWCDCKNQS